MKLPDLATVAQRQYYARPDDEKYADLAGWTAAADADKVNSATARINTADLTVEPHGSEVLLVGSTGTRARLTPWAFSQVCGFAGAPTRYLTNKDNGAAIARNLNEDFDALRRRIDDDADNAPRERNRILLRMPESPDGLPTVRAFNSEKYRRLWDADLGRMVQKLQDRCPNLDLPPVWEGGKGGAYRSDRDSFLLLTDGGSIVEDPTLRGGDGAMYRGLIIGNSEVGAGTAFVRTFMFRVVCGNLAIWDAESVADFSRRHIGRSFEYDVAAAMQQASRFLTAATDPITGRIRQLADTQIADTDKETIARVAAWLKIPNSTVEAGLRSAEQHEQCSPRSYWGMMQGLTRVSQEDAHFADRLALDMMAAKLANRVRVAA